MLLYYKVVAVYLDLVTIAWSAIFVIGLPCYAIHVPVMSRENIGRRLTLLLRVGRELLDVREQRVQTALLRGRPQEHDESRGSRGTGYLWGKQRMSL